MVIIGASYAEAWGEPPLGGFDVINRGIGGQQTHEMLARFERDVVSARPSAVLIWGHINNVHRAEPSAIDEAMARAVEDYREMVSIARSARIEVFLATEVTLPGAKNWWERIVDTLNGLRGKESYAAWVNGHVRNVNEWLRAFAAEQRIELLDFELVFDEGNGFRKREYTSSDGTHISDAGYAALTAYAQGRLGQQTR